MKMFCLGIFSLFLDIEERENMQKDISGKRLEEWNDVFADIFNNLVFGGKKVLEEASLISLPTESFTRNMDGTLRQGNRDVRKADQENGSYRLICGSENQQGIDNTMPQRIMGYEYASYEEQIRKLMDENRQNKDPAYIKRIHDGQKLAPVVTAVLYWGEEEWEKPRTLHDMLRFSPGQEKTIRPYVADYPMNLIHVAKLPEEVRARLTSDFRLIAEYAANRNNPEKILQMMNNKDLKIRHPEEFLDALSEVAGDKRYQDAKKIIGETGEKEEAKMDKVLDIILEKRVGEYEERAREKGEKIGREIGEKIGREIGEEIGKEIGRAAELVEMVCKKLRKGKQPEQIAEDLEKDLPEIEEICQVAAPYAPDYPYEEVLKAWRK